MIRLTLLVAMLLLVPLCFAQTAKPHPRPDFARADWQCLDGPWQFAFDPQDAGLKENWPTADAGKFPLKINVPFPWESKLSGIEKPDYKGVAWYRREFSVPEAWAKKWDKGRVWLCFGAVDWKATVWVNDTQVGEHEGGYSEFRLDITKAIKAGQPNRLTVRVEDRTERDTPIGKQIPDWYTSTSGIWQTVWLEATGQACVKKIKITPLADAKGVPTGEVRFDFEIDRGEVKSDLHLVSNLTTADFDITLIPLKQKNETSLTVRIPEPRLWTPDNPFLYDFSVDLNESGKKEDKTPFDKVNTYLGLRSVGWGQYAGSQHSYVLLNGKPIYVCGALDQSFNPDGIYTAPNDDFLKRDIELAKAAGFNMLRIHIKAEEPRRLYWADKLGMLIQQDIPCAYTISDRARKTFEQTMRDQIARDYNHPCIYEWTVFNEEWGIGQVERAPREHRVDWVEAMFKLAKELDPHRLIQDNTGWSHLITDYNSFHWYSRDVDGFRREYREINDQHIKPGDNWNYIAGRVQNGAPFVNNEYGYVSAGNGDGDWSWGVLFATNAMRACDKLVGYTYTELSDIEWEHNGVYNYDRTPKEFGYDYWAEGMTVRDVFAQDFLVLDAPAVKTAKPGEVVRVPAVFSHYTGAHPRDLVLKWQGRLLDSLGRWHPSSVQTLPCPETPPYRLTSLGEITWQIPTQPGIATLAAWLETKDGKRVHTNYTQWRVSAGAPLPRVEVLEPQVVLLRFRPEDFSASRFSEQSWPDQPINSKHYGRGSGELKYSLKLPDNVPLDTLQSVSLLCETAAKAGREKVDWARRVHPEDYPQTDGKRFPTTVRVKFNGRDVTTWQLPDDPADARGVLSHWAGVERGSYGQRAEAVAATGTPDADAILDSLRKTRRLEVTLEVPADAAYHGGLAIYGENMGCYPMEPTVVLKFREPLPAPLEPGWTTDTAVATDRFWDRQKVALPSARRGGTNWRFTTQKPAENWFDANFDDSAWKTGKSGFGQKDTPGAIVGTDWTTNDIWLRTTTTLPALAADDLMTLEVHHDEDCEIYVNGKPLWRASGYVTDYRAISLKPEQKKLFQEGKNTIAVHCRQTRGGQFIDVGLLLTPAK